MCIFDKNIMGVVHEESKLMGVVDMTEILRAIVGEEGSSRWEKKPRYACLEQYNFSHFTDS